MEQDFFNPRWEDGDVVYHARLPLEVASNRKLHCCVGIAILQRGEKYALAALPHDPSDMREDATTDGELLTAYEYDTISPLCDCICGGYFVGHSGGACGLLHLMAILPSEPGGKVSIRREEVTGMRYDYICASSWYTVSLYFDGMRQIYNTKTGEISDEFCGKPLPTFLWEQKCKAKEQLRSFSEEFRAWYYRSTRERKNVYRLHPFDSLQEFADICSKPGITLLLSCRGMGAEAVAHFLGGTRATMLLDEYLADSNERKITQNYQYRDLRKMLRNPSVMRELRRNAIVEQKQMFLLVTMPHQYVRLYDITGRHLQFRDVLTLGLGVRYADQIMLLHRDRYYCDSIPDYSPIAHTLEVKYQSEAIRRIFYLPWDYTSEDNPCRIKLGWEHKAY